MGILSELMRLFRGETESPQSSQALRYGPTKVHQPLSADYTGWTIFRSGNEFGRKWSLKGLEGPRPNIDIHVHVTIEAGIGRAAEMVSIIVDPGFGAASGYTTCQFGLEDKLIDAPFFTVQIGPMSGGVNASLIAPDERASAQLILDALWQCQGLVLTLFLEEKILIRAPLFNDPSYRDVHKQVYDLVMGT